MGEPDFMEEPDERSRKHRLRHAVSRLTLRGKKKPGHPEAEDRITPPKAADRTSSIEALRKLWYGLQKSTTPCLDRNALDGFGISLETLEINDDGSYAKPYLSEFFSPFPLDEIRALPVNKNEEGSEAAMDALDCVWIEEPGLGEDPLESARCLSSALASYFDYASRFNALKRGKWSGNATLLQSTMWKRV